MQQSEILSESESNESSHSSNGQCTELASDLLDVTAGFRSKPPMQVGGLGINYLITPPSELETAPSTDHFLMVNFSHGNRQVNQFDGGEYDGSVNSGDFFFLPSGISASWAWDTEDEGVAFTIDPDFLPHIAATTESLNPDKIELRSVLLDRDPQLETIARYFLSEMTTDGLGGRLYTESLANLLGIHLLRHYCTTPASVRNYQGGLSDFQLKCAIDYIRSNLDAQLSLENIATELNLSHYYFCVFFKQSMGISPWQYVIGQRVERAKKLLKNRELSISEVAFACGFSNQSHLNKHFRSAT
ncbi:AraC family transcriptional regulator, partial [Microcoleus sp. herbarium14]|uniref:AraC family transcriptional regulator n=1 Tax=Microcoleus sp. herbarium14 TaxID=3055439 RepID=UPI002FD3DF24